MQECVNLPINNCIVVCLNWGKEECGTNVMFLITRTPADFGHVTCTGTNVLGEGAPCVFQITRRLQLPGVHDCSLTNKDNSLAVICAERGPSCSPLVQGATQFLAELEDLKLGISTQLSSSRPTFQFSSVRPGAAFNLSVYRYGKNSL